MQTIVTVKENDIVTITPEQWADYAQYCNDNNLYLEQQENDVYIVRANKPDLIRPIREQIYDLKKKLADTDYQAIKYAEGELTEAEFSSIKEQRRQWRAEINALELQLQQLT